MKLPVAALLVAGIALSACSSTSDDAAPAQRTSTTVEEASSFWPAAPEDVAIIGSYDASGEPQLAVTDGADVIGLPELGGAQSFEQRDDLLAFVDEDRSLVGTLDLTTGQVRTAPCDRCRGIAAVDGRIVSVDEAFTMHVFEGDLKGSRSFPIEHVTEPVRDEPRDEPIPAVLGTLDGRVVISHLTTNGLYRGGPEVVSLYRLDGTLDRSWTVDGRTYGTQVDATGSRLVLAVGGSVAACASVAVPQIIDPALPEPIVLVPDADTEHEGGALTYFASDLWWNGVEVAAFGSFLGMPDGACAQTYRLRRFDLSGETSVVATSGISAYRLLGAGCDRALLVASTMEPDQLHAIDGDSQRPIEGYDSIVWSAARPARCETLPGIRSSG